MNDLNLLLYVPLDSVVVQNALFIFAPLIGALFYLCWFPNEFSAFVLLLIRETTLFNKVDLVYKYSCMTNKGIVEGRGANNGQIGMAAIDLNRPGVEVSQFTDTSGYGSTLMKMLVWMPTEVRSSF